MGNAPGLGFLEYLSGTEAPLQVSDIAGHLSALETGETVRAEETAIRVPDGRSVTTLINATPIASDEGIVAHQQ